MSCVCVYERDAVHRGWCLRKRWHDDVCKMEGQWERECVSYLCPCSSMAVPLRPPISHMMMEWSKLPENRSLCTGSQHSAVTLPGAQENKRTHTWNTLHTQIHVQVHTGSITGTEKVYAFVQMQVHIKCWYVLGLTVFFSYIFVIIYDLLNFL